jgi:hypothetical protein
MLFTVQLKQSTLQPSLRHGSGTKFVNDLATEPYWALGRLFAAILLFLPLKLPGRYQLARGFLKLLAVSATRHAPAALFLPWHTGKSQHPHL